MEPEIRTSCRHASVASLGKVQRGLTGMMRAGRVIAWLHVVIRCKLKESLCLARWHASADLIVTNDEFHRLTIPSRGPSATDALVPYVAGALLDFFLASAVVLFCSRSADFSLIPPLSRPVRCNCSRFMPSVANTG